MSVVPGVLLDHLQQVPTHRSPTGSDRGGRVTCGPYQPIRIGHLLAPLPHRRVDHADVEALDIGLFVVFGAVVESPVLTGEGVHEVMALHLGQVTHQTEKRMGEFNIFYGSIYLRTEKGLKEVPKYPYDRDRWILEKLFYGIRHTEVLAEKPGVYEPVHVLKDAMGGYLPLNWKVVKMIVEFAEGKPMGIHLTDKDWKEEERPAEPLKPHEGYYDNLYRAIRQGKPVLVRENLEGLYVAFEALIKQYTFEA